MLKGFYSSRQKDRDINSFDNFQINYKLCVMALLF